MLLPCCGALRTRAALLAPLLRALAALLADPPFRTLAALFALAFRALAVSPGAPAFRALAALLAPTFRARAALLADPPFRARAALLAPTLRALASLFAAPVLVIRAGRPGVVFLGVPNEPPLLTRFLELDGARFITAVREDGMENLPPWMLVRVMAPGRRDRNTDLCRMALDGLVVENALDGVKAVRVGRTDAGPNTGDCPLGAENPCPLRKIWVSEFVPL